MHNDSMNAKLKTSSRLYSRTPPGSHASEVGGISCRLEAIRPSFGGRQSYLQASQLYDSKGAYRPILDEHAVYTGFTFQLTSPG